MNSSSALLWAMQTDELCPTHRVSGTTSCPPISPSGGSIGEQECSGVSADTFVCPSIVPEMEVAPGGHESLECPIVDSRRGGSNPFGVVPSSNPSSVSVFSTQLHLRRPFPLSTSTRTIVLHRRPFPRSTSTRTIVSSRRPFPLSTSTQTSYSALPRSKKSLRIQAISERINPSLSFSSRFPNRPSRSSALPGASILTFQMPKPGSRSTVPCRSLRSEAHNRKFVTFRAQPEVHFLPALTKVEPPCGSERNSISMEVESEHPRGVPVKSTEVPVEPQNGSEFNSASTTATTTVDIEKSCGMGLLTGQPTAEPFHGQELITSSMEMDCQPSNGIPTHVAFLDDQPHCGPEVISEPTSTDNEHPSGSQFKSASSDVEPQNGSVLVPASRSFGKEMEKDQLTPQRVRIHFNYNVKCV
ncbi:hypothetical protein BLNAU_24593 [Blattamonas nauphoetae]|uniref:Uncharacterized protein n=1 Tax=Blattamonas nauphoetae TaxID=2049346 RepID=A0ABQ9WLZ6_9EUKA|nr:hypothetical protein BLNAU_24593 [Blattamonas nauphoetae]